MTRQRRSAGTGDLFASLPQPAKAVPGGMDYRAVVAALMSQMLAETQADNPEHDRYWVAGQVSRLVGKEVSKSMLDGYTSESRDAFNVPYWLVLALENVCRSTLLTDWYASMRGGRFLMGPEALDAEIGRMSAEVDKARDHLAQLKDLRRRIG
jgi:hypothetical protein